MGQKILLDYILYDGKHFDAISDMTIKRKMVDLSLKLKPLQQTILNEKDGRISILPNGQVRVTAFTNAALNKQITDLI